ncbi:MAG: ferrous iron transport protein B [Candidatus Omnitrophica bacterium]|nr:ferrous iron transport protein B [Candidatus Omnitrophota bacterium]
MHDSRDSITIALAGNPNSGKTTLFNQMTGHRQHVGNYPGVTVEKKDGFCRHKGSAIHVVDLPGAYSLTARSPEELAARNFLFDEPPDVIVDILDASNIERNLYLYTQLLELNIPLVIALNMSDMAKSRGIEFDLKKLSQLIGAPIIPTVAHKGRGVDELLDAVVSTAKQEGEYKPAPINLGRDIEKEIEKIQKLIVAENTLPAKYNPRWASIKLLENDPEIWGIVSSPDLRTAVNQSVARIEQVFGDHPEIVIADQRYGVISGACQEAIRLTVEARHTYSDKIDEVLTNRILGVPIFLLLMYVVFQFTFTFGAYPVTWLENGFLLLGNFLRSLAPNQADNILFSLIVDGIIGGVGGVVVFVPNIFLLFLAIAILEDSGYMARAAFNMDRFMHKIGLHGKSFIPMLIGFGCSVPAIMATRTLENRRDRFTTMLVIPLMSCGARLPIYTLIIPAFFPLAWQAPLLWIIYLIGVLLAIGGARLLRATLLKGDNDPFIMELPPYRLPTWKGISIHVFERTWMYLKKAGTIILAISVVIWALMYFPVKEEFDRDYEAESAQAEALFLDGLKHIHSIVDMEVSFEQFRDELEDHGGKSEIHHDESMQAFQEILHDIRNARDSFNQTIQQENIQEKSLDFVHMERMLDSTLMEIERRSPLLYSAAIQYLDELKKPFEEKRREIERSKHAEKLSYSMAGRIGRGMEPALKPLGFDWRIGTALLGAFAAKEVFVAQLGIVFSLGESEEHSDALRAQLRREYTPLTAFCIMLFCLIAMPCMATIAATRLESGSWKWALLQLVGLTAFGYGVTFIVFQTGRLFGLGI